MTDTIHLDQTATASIKAVDHKGNLVVPVFDTPPVWTSSDATVFTATASADGSTAEVDPVALGTATLSVSASIGGTVFTASDDVTVVAGSVASISIVLTPQ